jgi:hypothetical protein
MSVFLIIPFQWRAIQPYLHQKILIGHCKGITVGLPIEAPIPKEERQFIGQSSQWDVWHPESLILFRQGPPFPFDVTIDPQEWKGLSVNPLNLCI